MLRTLSSLEGDVADDLWHSDHDVLAFTWKLSNISGVLFDIIEHEYSELIVSVPNLLRGGLCKETLAIALNPQQTFT